MRDYERNYSVQYWTDFYMILMSFRYVNLPDVAQRNNWWEYNQGWLGIVESKKAE